MEVRHNVPDHEVIINASTSDGSLIVGPYPNYGWLIFNISVAIMSRQQPDAYVGDIVATDSLFSRRVITFNLDLVQGVTR
jgi:hypothetical protein